MRWTSLAACAALVGCASIPAASLPRLIALDPRILNFADFEVAVRMDEDFLIFRDGARIEIASTQPDGTQGESASLRLVAVEAAPTPALLRANRPGRQIRRFAIAPEDAEAAMQLRAAMLEAEKDKRPRRMKIAAQVSGCRERAAPAGDLALAIFLRDDPSKDFFMLMKETRIAQKPGGDSGLCDEDARKRL